MKNKFIVSLWFLILMMSAAFPQRSKKEQKIAPYQEIIILHVNDMHAQIDNMPKLAYLADSLRKYYPYVFLVSVGDNITGNPAVDLIRDKGAPVIDLMNRCKFSASVIGNHEFDLGQEMLRRRIEQANFPFIACNVNTSGTEIPQPEPFVILEAGNSELALLGITQTGQEDFPDAYPSKIKGLEFMNGIRAAMRFSWLKEKIGNLIVLSHLGIEGDFQLAEKMPSTDIVIGGHSHTLTDPPVELGNTMIVQAGSGLSYVGKITITARNGTILRKKSEMIALEEIKGEDPIVRKLVYRYNDPEELKRIVGEASTPLNGFNELGSFVTDAFRNVLKVDFAFQNRGAIRLDRLQEGSISVTDIYRLDPFNNHVIVFEMTGDEIRSLICNAFNREQNVDLAVSGMRYMILLDPYGQCQDVEMVPDSAGPMNDPEKLYTVAMNSYMAGAYRFDHRFPGNEGNTLTTQEIMIEYLENIRTVDYRGVVRTYVKRTENYKQKKY